MASLALGSISTKVQILTQGAAEGVRAWRRLLLDRMGSGGSRVSRGRYALYLLHYYKSTLLTCCFTSARALALGKWWKEGLEGQGLKLSVHEALSY
jgi:hypothetical protein